MLAMNREPRYRSTDPERVRRLASGSLRLSQGDLEFLVDTAAPDHGDKAKLVEIAREDEDFRKAFIASEPVAELVVSSDEVLTRISPVLYFQVLLTQALKELQQVTHTVERTGRDTVPVFDTKEVVDLLSQPAVLEYLTDLLASFTRIESYVLPVRVRRGIWRKVRFNDMDIDGLIRLCATADDERRLAYYKRIADVCLFNLGVFPEHARAASLHTAGVGPAPQSSRRAARSLEEYEEEGRRFYRMAGEHPTAKALEIAQLFNLLYDKFNVASKPLSFIARRYLAHQKRAVFGSDEP